MGLEAATYIDDLVETNPAGGDARSQGDNHIRLIKSAIKNTFPNITGEVTVTHDELNLLSDIANFIPPGLIVMWSGAVADVPAGWQLCNGTGTTTTGAAIPNLKDKFIVGSNTDAGGTYDIGDTGGTNKPLNGLTINSHALTSAEIPPHRHFVGVPTSYNQSVSTLTSSNSTATRGAPGIQADSDERYHLGGRSSEPSVGRTSQTGTGNGHTHTLANKDAVVVPPYYALAFIIKL